MFLSSYSIFLDIQGKITFQNIQEDFRYYNFFHWIT